MIIEQELSIFARCRSKFEGVDAANVTMGSILLARQLDPYIVSSLDLGWIVRHIIDLGSSKLYSTCRDLTGASSVTDNVDLSSEYRHAVKIIDLYHLCCAALRKEKLTIEEASKYKFSAADRFYYGVKLEDFNISLLRYLCDELEN